MNLKNNTLSRRRLLHQFVPDESVYAKFRLRSGHWLPLGRSGSQGRGGCSDLLWAGPFAGALWVHHPDGGQATLPQLRTARDRHRGSNACPFLPSRGPPTCSFGFRTPRWPGPNSVGLHCPPRLILFRPLPPPPAFPRVRLHRGLVAASSFLSFTDIHSANLLHV